MTSNILKDGGSLDSSGGDMQFLNDLSLDGGEEPVDEEEEAEMYHDLEKRKEEIIEEFLEYAFARKHEMVEEAKQESKRAKLTREEERKALSLAQSRADQLRKQGLVALTARMNAILAADDGDCGDGGDGDGGQDGGSLARKMERLSDREQIRAYIEKLF
jgi:hypothetical protein